MGGMGVLCTAEREEQAGRESCLLYVRCSWYVQAMTQQLPLIVFQLETTANATETSTMYKQRAVCDSNS